MSIVHKILSLAAGKRKFQPFFEKIYAASLYGMNIGGGDVYSFSGEEYVLKRIYGGGATNSF